MTSSRETSDRRNFPHWLILLIGLLIVVTVWCWWLFTGMQFARSEVLRHAVHANQTQFGNDDKSAQAVRGPTERTQIFSELGQTGDSFGGLNALFTALAGTLVAWAGFMQHQTLQKANLEAKEERKHRQRQEFESLFFQLLQLGSMVTDRIERRDKETTKVIHRGSRALDSYAGSVFRHVTKPLVGGTSIELLNSLVGTFFVKAYDRAPSAFGPYFRVLYQTFKHIAESQLDEHEQIRYANIARGQISEGAVLLLALNGLTETGYKFLPLIEKFGLLEHMHRRYRGEFSNALLIGYRNRAFLGSKERAAQANLWIDTPILDAKHFSALEKKRMDSDADVDFENGFKPDSASDE